MGSEKINTFFFTVTSVSDFLVESLMTGVVFNLFTFFWGPRQEGFPMPSDKQLGSSVCETTFPNNFMGPMDETFSS